MPPIAFSGTLHNRKKADLAAIASALKLSQEGTASDIKERIKAHLDANQKKLEKNPQFSGLYLTSRQRRDRASSETVSEQAFQPPSLPSSRLAPERDSTPPRRIKAPALSLETVVETPSQDGEMHAISAMLKQPEPPTPYPAYHEASESHQLISTGLPPLPASAAPSISTMVITKPQELVQKIIHADPTQSNTKWVRQKLSSSWNLWCLTAVVEFATLLSILRSEGRFIEPLGPEVVRPLTHWILPSLVIPIIAGTLISFNTVDFDPLTANVVRAAAYYLWPYHMYGDVDLLGEKWRMTGALLNVAFALAEAVQKAPTRVIPQLEPKRRPTEQRLLQSSASDHEDDHIASEEVD